MKPSRTTTFLALFFALTSLCTGADQLGSIKVMSVTGSVSKEGESGEFSPIKAGDIFGAGNNIKTSGLSAVSLAFSNGSEIRLRQKTTLEIKEFVQDSFESDLSYEKLESDPSESRAVLNLDYGKIDGHVKNLRPGSQFLIETPFGTVAILGTNFSVEVGFNTVTGAVGLSVANSDGTVEFTPSSGDGAGTAIPVPQGQTQEASVSPGDAGYAAVANQVAESAPADAVATIGGNTATATPVTTSEDSESESGEVVVISPSTN
ncbi:MAG: FecR family protein [Lentimonas sp.]